jgi:hypothetical protein
MAPERVERRIFGGRNAVAILLPLLIACRSSAPPPTSTTPVEPRTRNGAVSARLLPDPDAPAVQLGPDEELLPAVLMSNNHLPRYPEELLALDLRPHVVAVRVTFDDRGAVLSIADSPVRESTEGEHTRLFKEAVEQAVSEWRCLPAAIRKFRDGPDYDGDGLPDFRVMAGQRILKTFFDVSFTFAIVDRKPVVTRTI